MVNVSITCIAAYLASLATLVGSALVATVLPWNLYIQPGHFLVPFASQVVMGPTCDNCNGDLMLQSDAADSDNFETEIESLVANIANLSEDLFTDNEPMESLFNFSQRHLKRSNPTQIFYSNQAIQFSHPAFLDYAFLDFEQPENSTVYSASLYEITKTVSSSITPRCSRNDYITDLSDQRTACAAAA